MYTRAQFGKELRKVLQKPYQLEKVTHWADQLYSNQLEELTEELYDLTERLSMMSLAEEMEFNEEELNLLADKLISDEENALQQVSNIVRRRHGKS